MNASQPQENNLVWKRVTNSRTRTIAGDQHRPEENRVTWETPSSVVFPLLQEPIGVLASYAPHVQMQE